MSQPIRVSRICDRYPLAASQGGKLSVAVIEPRECRGIREILIFAVLPSREVDSLDSAGSAIEYLQIEPVSDTRLTARAQMSVIFGFNLSRQIQDHATIPTHVQEELDCRFLAHWRGQRYRVF